MYDIAADISDAFMSRICIINPPIVQKQTCSGQLEALKLLIGGVWESVVEACALQIGSNTIRFQSL